MTVVWSWLRNLHCPSCLSWDLFQPPWGNPWAHCSTGRGGGGEPWGIERWVQDGSCPRKPIGKQAVALGFPYARRAPLKVSRESPSLKKSQPCWRQEWRLREGVSMAGTLVQLTHELRKSIPQLACRLCWSDSGVTSPYLGMQLEDWRCHLPK